MNATIQAFPASRLDAARDALAKSYARLARAAAKTGQVAPPAPALRVVREFVRTRCEKCRHEQEGFMRDHVHATSTAAFVDLELVAERPALAGWEFLAVVEPLQGGNLIRQVPGASIAEGELAPWADASTTGMTCDHCKSSRHRKEVFIVRADGTAEIPAGTHKQVGRNCLEAFLGGKSAATIVAIMAWPDVVREAGGDGEDGGGFGCGETVHDPIKFLSWVASVVRLDGWISRTQAHDVGTLRATADTALWLLTRPFGSADAWLEERARLEPTPDDIARATAALAWARGLEGASDYERNLSLVAKQEALAPKHAGILASAIPGHTRALGREVERRQRAARNAAQPSKHVGEVKARLGFDLVVERVIETATEWGALHILVMRDHENNLIVWKTGAASAQPGDRLRIKGTVKRHADFKGEKQTELTRCEVVERILAGGRLVDFAIEPSAPPSIKLKRKHAKKVANDAANDVDTVNV